MKFLNKDIKKIQYHLYKYINKNIDSDFLRKSMIYAIDGGKMIRGILFIETLKGFNYNISKNEWLLAGAIEMIHAYSLIHDDLPCMDDDDFRRGKPSVHKKFGEAEAVLTGDALLTEVFALITSLKYSSNTIKLLIKTISKAAGANGMIYGQLIDLNEKFINIDNMIKCHQLKTGKMLTIPFIWSGIILNLPPKNKNKLILFGEIIGQMFQAVDDLLDVTADFKELGKTLGKDSAQEKVTYISLIGIEGTKKIIEEYKNNAFDILSSFQLESLKKLTLYLAQRRK